MLKKNEPEWPITDWTAFEQQQANASEVPETVPVSVAVVRFLRGMAALDGKWFGEHKSGQGAFWWRKHLPDPASAAHEPKGEVPKLLTNADVVRMAPMNTNQRAAFLRERGLIAPEPEPDALRDLAEELARESQDLILPLRKRVDWFEAQLRARGVTAPARGEEA